MSKETRNVWITTIIIIGLAVVLSVLMGGSGL